MAIKNNAGASEKPSRRKKTKTRVYSRYDMLPGIVQELIDERLRNPAITYLDIVVEVAGLGYEISRSSIGRHALSRYKNNQALTLRLEIAKEQARIAADMAKDTSVAGYAKGAINIVMAEVVNRVLSADSTEYDNMDMTDVLKSISRLVKDMTGLAKFELAQDKGKKAAMAEMEALVEQYLGDDPELKERILSKVTESMEDESEVN